jgi:hypothetical protein
VHGIKPLGLRPAQVQHLGGHDLEPALLDALDHLADEAAGDPVRFDDRQRSLHDILSFQ